MVDTPTIFDLLELFPCSLLSFEPKVFYMLFSLSHLQSSHEFFIILLVLAAIWAADLSLWDSYELQADSLPSESPGKTLKWMGLDLK